MSELRTGDVVPSFILPNADGIQYSLEAHKEQHKGCWHLIVFFRGSWSQECVRSLHQLEHNLVNFHKEHVTVLAIASQSSQGLSLMVKREALSFPVLADEFLTIIEAFGTYTSSQGEEVFGEPAFYLINDAGELLYQQKQSGPYGRSCPEDLLKTIGNIKQSQEEKGSAS